MKARRLSEIRDLVRTEGFLAWWNELVKVRALLEEARERHDELLSQAMLMDFRAELTQKNAIDTLYRAGDLEDAAAQMMVEAQQLENGSLKTVADFEEQRFRSSESWYRVCALERRAEELRERQSGSERGTAGRARGQDSDPERLGAELKKLEKALAQAIKENQREEQAKIELWQKAEHAWGRSTELDLLIAEHKVRSKKVRTAAERLFKQAEERKQRAARLRAEAESAAREREAAESRVEAILAQTGERFGCAHGEELLYFRQLESPSRAWCVPLVEDGESYNIEIKPLTAYAVDQKRGAQFIEPAVERTDSPEEGDRRFEDYFLKGRKGTAPAAAGERKSA
jgi:hypothetical protein